MTRNPGPLIALLLIGAFWGMATPLIKIAVAHGHRALGIIQWQVILNVIVLATLCLFLRRPLPLSPPHLRLYLVIGLLGIVMPHSASYSAAQFLPSGVLSVIVSLVPLFALPVALLMGVERFRASRGFGLLMGALAMVLLVGPRFGAPESMAWIFVLVGALAPLCYALEGAYVSALGVRDVDALQTLLGGSLIAALAVTPLAMFTGQMISPFRAWGVGESAIVASAGVSVIAYMGYVWLLRQAGAVFAAQVAYLVTGFGVLWAMLLLAEVYHPSFWLALLLLFGGIFLVQPRPAATGDEALGTN